tara:strand:+ start:851 stop:1138 length:288 start_codon:yes stop_codon:yes gene_type:complete
MALITLSEAPDAPIDGFDGTKLQANTATGFISAVYSSLDRVTGEAGTPQNFDINNLDYSGPLNNQPYQKRRPSRGFLRGRRPYFGLLFPRGYYNR